MGSHSKDDWVEGDPDPDDDEVVEAELIDDDAFLSAADEALLEEARVLAESEETFVDGTVGRSDLATERDEYRDALMRVKADFENYKKRVAKDQTAMAERAAEKLVSDLLPVLDACEAALGHGAEDVEPIFKSLLDVLEKGGLVPMLPEGQPFDPNLHEAVIHEPSDDDDIIVLESLRRGYLWNGRVVRPAMVKVKG
jgi:molecular chaperone GrpE